MNRKRHPWLLLLTFPSGLLLAVYQPLLLGTNDTADFNARSVLTRFCLYAIGLICLWLFLPRLIRWFFTWRTFKWLLRIFAVFVVLVALFYVEEDWRGKHDWDNYRRIWEAKGEKFDLASFIPPPVPDNQNFALTPIVAGCYSRYLDKNGHRLRSENTNVVNRLDMEIYRDNCLGCTNLFGFWQLSQKTDLISWRQYYRASTGTDGFPSSISAFPTSSKPQAPAADVLLALSKYDPVLEELRQAAGKCTESRFPLNYQDTSPPVLILSHLSIFLRCGDVLELRSIAEIADHKSDKALADMRLILRLADSLQSEPACISQLYRLSLMNRVIQPIWEGAATHQWTENQLAEIQRGLDRTNWLGDYLFTLRSWRATSLATIEFMRNHRSQALNCISGGLIPLPARLLSSLPPDGWFYSSEIIMGKIYQAALSAPNADARELIAAAQSAEGLTEHEREHVSPGNMVALLVSPEIEATTRKFIFTKSAIDLARLACALERFNLAYGRYPENLDLLAPQFIKSVPHDIVNGQSLHYRRTPDGRYQIYSVGWNGRDDGGTPGPYSFGEIDYRKGDLVWQYSTNEPKPVAALWSAGL